jgi:hypothetical protein
MGFFDFGPKAPYKRITVHEYREKIVPQLHALRFHGTDLGIVEGLIEGNLEEGGKHHEGVDGKEVETILSWLHENRSKHTLSSHQIEQLSDLLHKYVEKHSS